MSQQHTSKTVFDPTTQNLLWVAPDAHETGSGSFDEPFDSIETAIKEIQPGQTIVLKDGTYPEDSTIQTGGTRDNPIRICAQTSGSVTIDRGCWFLYDVADVIVSGIVFSAAPHGAISMVGKCERNRIEHCSFIDCGTSNTASSTIFFGGSASNCTIVEDCRFEQSGANDPVTERVAILISHGDIDNGAPLTNYLVRRNSITGYTYGVVVGSSDEAIGDFSHIVEYNTFRSCSKDAIVIKCGDTRVIGNDIAACGQIAISVINASCATIENNRIIDTPTGVHLAGDGHMVSNNCLARCMLHAIVCDPPLHEIVFPDATFIEENTLVNCGERSSTIAGQPESCVIRIGQPVVAVISKNLFIGSIPACFCEVPQSIVSVKSGPLLHDNRICTTSQECPGFDNDSGTDNFSNTTEYGAHGIVLSGTPVDPKEDAEFPKAELPDEEDAEAEIEFDDGKPDEDEPATATGQPVDLSEILNTMFGMEVKKKRGRID